MQDARVEIEARGAGESIERADGSGKHAAQHSESYPIEFSHENRETRFSLTILKS